MLVFKEETERYSHILSSIHSSEVFDQKYSVS